MSPTYDFRPFTANITTLAFGTEPIVLLFRCRYSGLLQARRMDRRSALGARNQGLVFVLAVFLARTQAFGAKERRRLHLSNDQRKKEQVDFKVTFL